LTKLKQKFNLFESKPHPTPLTAKMDNTNFEERLVLRRKQFEEANMKFQENRFYF